MSYVGKPFEYDIFISYAHAWRGKDVESTLKAWSAAFTRALKTHLLGPKRFSQSPERTLRIYFDETSDGVSGMQPLREQIRSAAESSAFFTILMSEDYLTSTFCKDELGWWDAYQKNLSFQNHNRIVVVRAEPTVENQWPPRIKGEGGIGYSGYVFHEAQNNPKDIALPLGYPIPNPAVPGPFQTAFLSLARVFWEQLQTLNEEIEKGRVEEAKAASRQGAKPTVYLHGRSDQATFWDDFRSKLRGGGFAVLPTTPDPLLKDPLQEERLYEDRIKTMRDCDALLVMGTPNDSAFDADLTYVSRRARRSLESRGSPLLPCALLDSSDEAERIDRRKTVAEDLDVKWIDARADPWTPQVRSWLQSVGSSGATP